VTEVLLKTPLVSGVTGSRPDGTVERGSAYFIATLYTRDEPLPQGSRAVSLATWRKDGFAQTDGSLRIPPPAFFNSTSGVPVPAAVVPAAVLDTLPDDALIELEWRIVHTHGGGR
jgi:hypothetical protein